MEIFWTVFSGVTIYAGGQIILKLFIEPVHDMKRTISQISHTLSENGDAIYTFRYCIDKEATDEKTKAIQTKIDEASQNLRKLSAQLHAHILLVPIYDDIASVSFSYLPTKTKVLAASKDLMWLANNIHPTSSTAVSGRFDVAEKISKKHERICTSLGIYFPDDLRRPTDEKIAPAEVTHNCIFSSLEAAMKVLTAMSA